MFIERDGFKQAVLSAVADKEMMMILDCATHRSKSINDVIRETRISHSTIYRKIKWMMGSNLLFTEKIAITPDGKKFSPFKSTLKSINIKCDQGEVGVEVEYNVHVLQSTAERLFFLDSD